MPGGFQLPGQFANAITISADTANSRGVAVTYAAANTKGSYVQLTASTTSDAAGLIVSLRSSAAQSFNSATDIAIGAAGSERVIADSLLTAIMGSTTGAVASYNIPVAIPAGTRIAARAQGDTGADTVYVGVMTYDGSYELPTFSGVESIGFSTATSKGTSIDPGGTINTVGSYTQLTAATSRDYDGFIYSIDSNLQSASTPSLWSLLDIAIGGSGSEVIILPQQQVYRENNVPAPMGFGPIWISIPAGTRIAARTQCASNAANLRNVALTLYGIYK